MIEAQSFQAMGEPDEWWIKGLTWAGHEFLEASRDDSRWNKAKKITWEKTKSLSFEILNRGIRLTPVPTISCVSFLGISSPEIISHNRRDTDGLLYQTIKE
ncbi:MAG: DUF2513 domain-containing protein, partial [Deltaproteobacteria bacterium]|nr:DUF2513 domain-containing protein [Deltaproteobacteria bacterium]